MDADDTRSKCSAVEGWEGKKGPYVLGRIQFLLDFISSVSFGDP
jgi:hypothetical protein